MGNLKTIKSYVVPYKKFLWIGFIHYLETRKSEGFVYDNEWSETCKPEENKIVYMCIALTKEKALNKLGKWIWMHYIDNESEDK